MSRSPLSAWSRIASVGVPVTGAGSWLVGLAGVPKTTAITIGGALLILAATVATLPRIFESIYRHKAAILREKKEVITAKSEARALQRRTKTESKITKIGLRSAQKADLAERMIQVRALSTPGPDSVRLADLGSVD